MNLQETIRRILREELESKWNEGDYDYQHGFCHYFAYNIIDKIRERFPNKDVKYYSLMAKELEYGDVVEEYLVHTYIMIDNLLLDSNGFTTIDKAWGRLDDWEERQEKLIPDHYDLEVWDEESNEIPEMFFNNNFCNTNIVKKDMDKFLSNPIVKRLFRNK